jgi:hypothetical protein
MGVDIYLTKKTDDFDHSPDIKDIYVIYTSFGTLNDFNDQMENHGGPIDPLYGSWSFEDCQNNLKQFEKLECLGEKIHWLFPIIYAALKKAVDEDWELHIY